MMTIQNLFPTPVGFFEYSDLKDEEIKYLSEKEQRKNVGNTSSEDRYILKNKEMKNIKSFIEKCVTEYFNATFIPKDDIKLRITQSWLNWSKPGEFHHKHAHPNSLISGCLYISADKKTDKIMFYKDGYKTLDIMADDWNAYNSNSWWFPVGRGELILFPSSLTHSVEPVEGTETRISLSFNTFPVGRLGDFDTLTELYLEK